LCCLYVFSFFVKRYLLHHRFLQLISYYWNQGYDRQATVATIVSKDEIRSNYHQCFPRAIRQVIDIPIDIYVEAPDDIGGFIRHYDVPEIIRVAAPVYIKFGLRNSPNIYPSGTHLEATSIALVKERVHRARFGLDIIQRYASHLKTSKKGAAGLAVPVAGEGLEI
jgi:hypothetical protein